MTGFSIRLARWQKWLLIIIAMGGGLWTYEAFRVWKENSQDQVILAAAKKYGVDAALIKAVVWRESRFNPNAKGKKGEIGLMQIMRDTAGEWARAEKRQGFVHTELYSPSLNTQCGTWYLRKVLLRYVHTTDHCIPYALADYNAGRGNVLKWNKGAAATNSAAFISQIGFPATREYVQSIMSRYERYSREGFGRESPSR